MRKLLVNELSKGTIPTETTSYVFKADHTEVTSIQVVWASSTASFAYEIQTSNDGTNYLILGSSQAISNNSGMTHTQIKGVKESLYYKVVCTKTSGALTGWSVLVANQPR